MKLSNIDDRVMKALRRRHPVLGTIIGDSPLTVQLDSGQVVESPFVFGGGAPAVGERVMGLWIQGGHDLALVAGGGASAAIPRFGWSGEISYGSYTPVWYPPVDIPLGGKWIKVYVHGRPASGADCGAQLQYEDATGFHAPTSTFIGEGSYSGIWEVPDWVVLSKGRPVWAVSWASQTGWSDLVLEVVSA